MDKEPLVSICMPIYNGERFIRQALDSLLAQEYRNFELIISDNASTDKTSEICKDYLAKDKRIQYFRNEINLGAVKNFNFVFERSRGKYFMFSGDHDLWHPMFISRCVSILEEEPNVVLAYSKTMLIDMHGNPIGIMSDEIDTRGMTLNKRYKFLIWNLSWCNMFYGVIRRDVFAQTERCRNIWAFDTLILAELALKGEFAQIDEPLFFRRKNRPSEDLDIKKKRVFYALDPASAADNCRRSYLNLTCMLGSAHLEMLVHSRIAFLDKIDLLGFTAFKFLLLSLTSILAKMGQTLKMVFVMRANDSKDPEEHGRIGNR